MKQLLTVCFSFVCGNFMTHRTRSLTLIFTIPFLISYGQDSLQIHFDTVRFVKDSVQRYEGGNGKVYGPITRYFLKESYESKPGYNKIFRENGKIYFEGEYILNDSALIKKGLFNFYSTSGQLDYTHDFDTKQRTYYFNNGAKKSEGHTNDSEERTGIWTCYYSTGVIKSRGKVERTLKYGEWKYFNKKGNLKESINYKQWTGTGVTDCCDWK